jgi:hypothetical protein
MMQTQIALDYITRASFQEMEILLSFTTSRMVMESTHSYQMGAVDDLQTEYTAI